MLVQRIKFEGNRAIGICVGKGGNTRTVHARREVILTAGAIASPMLLQGSGVGSDESLDAAGVKQVHMLPGVGEKLTGPSGSVFPVSLQTACKFKYKARSF